MADPLVAKPGDVLDREPDPERVVDRDRGRGAVLEARLTSTSGFSAAAAWASSSRSSLAVAEMNPSTWRARIASM